MMPQDFHSAMESAERCARLGTRPYCVIRSDGRFVVVPADRAHIYPKADLVAQFGRAGREEKGPAYNDAVNGPCRHA